MMMMMMMMTAISVCNVLRCAVPAVDGQGGRGEVKSPACPTHPGSGLHSANERLIVV
jgi:hypothetical protein